MPQDQPVFSVLTDPYPFKAENRPKRTHLAKIMPIFSKFSFSMAPSHQASPSAKDRTNTTRRRERIVPCNQFPGAEFPRRHMTEHENAARSNTSTPSVRRCQPSDGSTNPGVPSRGSLRKKKDTLDTPRPRCKMDNLQGVQISKQDVSHLNSTRQYHLGPEQIRHKHRGAPPSISFLRIFVLSRCVRGDMTHHCR